MIIVRRHFQLGEVLRLRQWPFRQQHNGARTDRLAPLCKHPLRAHIMRAATAEIFAPGEIASSSIRALASSDQRRRGTEGLASSRSGTASMTANVPCLDLGADCKQTSRENHRDSVAAFTDPRNTGSGGRLPRSAGLDTATGHEPGGPGVNQRLGFTGRLGRWEAFAGPFRPCRWLGCLPVQRRPQTPGRARPPATPLPRRHRLPLQRHALRLGELVGGHLTGSNVVALRDCRR